MEKWRELRDDGGKGKGNLHVDFRIENYCFDPSKERLRGVFDHLLVAFAREKCASNCIRPIPALCGDGRPVDLFKLFWIVRKIGGHSVVSRNNLWGFVSEECGFGSWGNPFIKLVYMKYLNELDQWLQGEFGKSDVVQKLDLFHHELENTFRASSLQNSKRDLFTEGNRKLCNGMDLSRKIDEGTKSKAKKSVNGRAEDGGDGLAASTKEIINRVIDKILNSAKNVVDEKHPIEGGNDNNNNNNNGCEKFKSQGADLSKISVDEERSSAQMSDIGKELELRKRKRQSFSGMLGWLALGAKNPYDLSIGSIPKSSKWGEYGGEKLWKQALLVREALRIKRKPNANAQQSLLKDQQKKPRMHPSMYEDDVCGSRFKEKQRYSTRIPSSTRPTLCPCCSSCTSYQKKKPICREEKKQGNNLKVPEGVVAIDIDKTPVCSDDHHSSDHAPVQSILLGPLYQAEVPEWTATPSESDPKWLGTRMWQPDDDNMNWESLIGKGREVTCTCTCLHPNSVECVRFHIAEKRLKLMQELGPLFFRWHFHQMGEEVSLSWTEEEEKLFKDAMKSCASSRGKFWKNASRFLPSKKRPKLISYYFNVFLIRCRSYQNRATPKDIDSDDDEKECGSVGSGFGYKALYMPGPSSIPCTSNKESFEFR